MADTAPAEAPSISASANADDALIPSPLGYGALRMFKPGQSGNPAGRPPDAERFFQRLVRQDPKVLDRAAQTVARILEDPKNRHFATVLRELLDRNEGPVTQATHHHVSTDRTVVVHPATGTQPELPERAGGAT